MVQVLGQEVEEDLSQCDGPRLLRLVEGPACDACEPEQQMALAERALALQVDDGPGKLAPVPLIVGRA